MSCSPEIGDVFGEDNVAQWADLEPEEEESFSILSDEAVANNERLRQEALEEQDRQMAALARMSREWN